MLNGLILGESLLNDAMAIVMCHTINDFNATSAAHGEEDALLMAVGSFFINFFGSMGVGVLVAASNALLAKFAPSIQQNPAMETGIFILLSYSSYLVAQALDLSGIISILFCGVMQGHTTQTNMSEESRRRTHQLTDLLASLAENFIFNYLGITMFVYVKHNFDPSPGH